MRTLDLTCWALLVTMMLSVYGLWAGWRYAAAGAISSAMVCALLVVALCAMPAKWWPGNRHPADTAASRAEV